MNVSGVSRLTKRPLTGTWYRAIRPHFWQTALATSYTSNVESRFSDGANGLRPYQTLYVAENPQIALFEVGALFGSPTLPGGLVPNPASSWTMLNVSVTLQTVVDLSLQSEQIKVDTSVQELTGDWRGYRERSAMTAVKEPFDVPAPTQELGAALFALADIEGFIAVSAKLPYCQNLVIFPEKLQAGSSVVFSYPATGEVFRIP